MGVRREPRGDEGGWISLLFEPAYLHFSPNTPQSPRSMSTGGGGAKLEEGTHTATAANIDIDIDTPDILPCSNSPALKFSVLARCSTTRARVARMTLPHGATYTPVFMPVGGCRLGA